MPSPKLTPEDFRIIHLALNEVCNGVDFSDDEFLARLGYTREEALAVMDKTRVLRQK